MTYMIANLLLALLPPTRWFALKRGLLRALGISIGDDAQICGGVRFYGGGRVVIGRGSWIGLNTSFYASVGADIEIGDNCDIAPEVSFVTGSHEIGNAARRAGKGIATPITVGNGCWIGARALFLGGATIGEGSIVGAGALVLPEHHQPHVLLHGAPARVQRQLER